MPVKLLLLSNSTNKGEGYLEYPRLHIKEFLGNDVRTIMFIPYAAVTISYDDYAKPTAKVFSDLGYTLESIHKYADPLKALSGADAIAVGGGNTFQLISELHNKGLMGAIRERVQNGMPYIGWSAGSNVACPTIMTTNDMPVTEPPSFAALNLIPFQINPHYTEATIPNHGGESRLQRINEYLALNKEMKVAALPEGCIIQVKDNTLSLVGTEMKIMEFGKMPRTIHPDDRLQNDLTPL
ncbi:MAG: dipeptidase PepE [Flavobacteriales bacterium]